MRGAAKKGKDPVRQTRSRPLRPLRAKPAAAVKKAASPAKQATPPAKLATPPAKLATSPAKQATLPAKQVTSPAKQATSPAKSRKTCKDKEEPVKHEPIQVVPGNMKKNQNPKKKTEPKMGVESGKVGKRKTKLSAKKDIIKKLSSKMENKLENVLNTLLEVATNTAVKKSEPKTAEKAKKKKLEKEKDTNKKEKTEKKVKEGKKGKEEKPSKEPARKKAKFLQKDTKNSKKGIKRDKESKGLKGGVKEIIEVEAEIEEEIKKERDLSIEDRGIIIQERTEIKVELVKVKEEKDQIIEARNIITENIAVERKKKTTKGESKPKSKPTAKEAKKTGKAKGKSDNVKMGQKVKLEKGSPATVKEVDKANDAKDAAARKGKKNDQEKKSDKKPKTVKLVKKMKKAPIPKNIKKAKDEKKEDLLILEKRHREASLNALAKVHCLYENESKGAMNEILNNSKRKCQEVKSDTENEDIEEEEEKPSRNLRTTPGMRSVGRHWDVFGSSLSSSSPSPASTTSEEEVEEEPEEEVEEVPVKREEEPKEVEKPEEIKPKTRKRRKRNELTMDLKDMVVRKRMASLNASAMMAATYSMEKRSKSDDKRKTSSQRSSDESSSSVVTESSEDEVGLISNKKGVTVLVNQQDSTSDVTITGFCTSRSTRHEGFCSFAGMQYRISSTSHTQTEATAVSSETVIHTTDVSVSHSESSGSVVESGGGTSPGGSCKSYTPLGALSSMQPPGQGRPCGSSAFSAPPYLPHHQEHAHGYYQPAGPLISQHGVPPPKPGTPEPPPPYPTAAYSAPYPPAGYSDYPGYYRGYRRPWHPGPSQMMADYMEPPYPPHPNYYPYPPPPPPPPPCYTTPVRGLPFIDPSYQPCPCPLQSCPKNVHTGPLTGASKGSGGTEAQNSEVGAPLPPPVALALPLEPVGASLGPPSPARGSAALMQPLLTHDILSSVDGDDAGMPPPCSPALSTARNTSWSPPAPALLQPITPEPLTTTVVEEGLQVGQLPAAPIALPKRKMKKEESLESEQQQQQPRKRRRHSVMMSAKNNKARGKPTGGGGMMMVKTEPEEAEEALCVIPPRRLQPTLRWSNGWSWEGEAYLAPVYLSTDVNPVKRRCYPGMRHMEGDLLKCRDCVLLKPPGPKKQQLPFVAKISQLWEDPEDGEMMVSLMWYYRPEHTEQGRQPSHSPDEVFASRHRDVNSVACIEDRCYVITFNEYCRYQKMLRLKRDGRHIVPDWAEENPRKRYTPQSKVAPDLVFFCRKIYDFRLKKVPKRPPPNI